MPPHDHHHEHVRKNLRVGVITASDTRAAASDKSGAIIREMLTQAGHSVAYYEVVTDDADRIVAAVRAHLGELDAVIITGGTGVAARDSTIEAIRPILDKELEGFGEIFRMLSYQQVGSRAILSRALAGVAGGRFIAALPGSTAACRLAMEKLIIPEIGHIAGLLTP